MGDQIIADVSHLSSEAGTGSAPSEALAYFGIEKGRELLLKMMQIRFFEEKAEELYFNGKVHGTMHLSIGQEAVAVGLASALRRTDYLLNTHRGHGHCLAWGSDVNLMMAEFLGKETGYCRGRGGSMHIADVEANNLGANGIVGGNLPISVGVGLSIRLRKTDQVIASIFGDGAANTGAFHESVNMIAIWDLPVVLVCENNQYAMSFSWKKAFKLAKISDRASGYGIPGITVDGNDPLAVHQAVLEAAERARAGKGATLIEAVTYRWRGHSKSDRQTYRTREEVKSWQEKDPITRFASKLGIEGAEMKQLQEQAESKIQAAIQFAEESPEPDIKSILDGVYA
jgi:pyruvate dehydrogenase E1 component alpha subunit